MKTPAAHIAALLLAAALPAAFAQNSPKDAPPREAPPKDITVAVTLQPGKVHEECVKLAKGQSRRFDWTASANVDFNVHFHKGDAAFYPFKANSRKAAKAKFTADHADTYCWMWTALKEPAEVAGTIR